MSKADKYQNRQFKIEVLPAAQLQYGNQYCALDYKGSRSYLNCFSHTVTCVFTSEFDVVSLTCLVERAQREKEFHISHKNQATKCAHKSHPNDAHIRSRFTTYRSNNYTAACLNK